MSKRLFWLPAGVALLCTPHLNFIAQAVAQTPPASAAGSLSQPPQPQPPQLLPLPAAKGIAVPEVVVEQAKPAAAPVKAPAAKPMAVASQPAPKPKAVVIKWVPKPVAVEPTGPAPSLPVFDTNSVKPVIAPAASSPAFAAPISGQTVTSTNTQTSKDRPAFKVGDLLGDVPGVSVKQGNGPRDIGVSIRGSNARNGFGIRNVILFEDGFPVTQPDGLGRGDLIDPHAYAGVDVFRGPSSSLFGNYATGGAMNFASRPGGEINGVEYGVDVGSFGYLNTFFVGGAKFGNAEFSVFASDARGDGYLGNSDYSIQTVNAVLTFKPTAQDTITLKTIHNETFTHLAIRQSMAQFIANPYQKGCATNATKAAGCPTINLFINGYGGATQTQTANETGLNRDDTRTILGARWEHAFDPLTVWRTQIVWDDKDVDQPTSNTRGLNEVFSWNLTSDLTKRTELFGLQATHMVGIYYNFTEPTDSDSYNVLPGPNTQFGRLRSKTQGQTSNLGFRLREELRLDPRWTLAAGIAIESTHLTGKSTSLTYSGAGVATAVVTSADRDFHNTAPEASLSYRPDDTLQVRGRVSTGYGTPQFSNLFVNATGNAGNNTNLEAQTNVGYDLGVVWAPTSAFKIDITGFYEFFENELVSQAPPVGGGTGSFTFNAPASEHRGVEVAATVKPLDRVTLTAAYLHNDQIYTQYREKLAGVTNPFDRVGHKIPGIAPNELTARLGYDQPTGSLKGFGTFVEYQWRDAFYMDNANLLTAGPSETVNLNVHYNTSFQSGLVRHLTAYFEVHNILDRVNIAGANNVANTVTAGAQDGTVALITKAGNSIYAAEPRAFYGGVKLKF